MEWSEQAIIFIEEPVFSMSIQIALELRGVQLLLAHSVACPKFVRIPGRLVAVGNCSSRTMLPLLSRHTQSPPTFRVVL